ncbi:MAG TPA: hypothetical protein PJ990_15565, partial [Saprospiraceae bacterium]|nr:hypothetical protein [Saprospiraceae bacterium]
DTLLKIISLSIPIKVIILTSHYNDSMIVKLLDEGAAGFLAKNEHRYRDSNHKRCPQKRVFYQ